MIDYDGPEPTDEEVMNSTLPQEGFDEFWYERQLLSMIRIGADHDGIYRGSTKRLALEIGASFHDVHVLLLLMDFRGDIEVVEEGIKLSKRLSRWLH